MAGGGVDEGAGGARGGAVDDGGDEFCGLRGADGDGEAGVFDGEDVVVCDVAGDARGGVGCVLGDGVAGP